MPLLTQGKTNWKYIISRRTLAGLRLDVLRLNKEVKSDFNP